MPFLDLHGAWLDQADNIVSPFPGMPRLATFYSRSRKGRWCKGETSGHFIHVKGVFVDCDRDFIIYLSDPIGPSCHTGARCDPIEAHH